MKSLKRGALVAVMLLCTAALFAKSKGEKIEAGSADDPFVSTSWESKGVALLEFKDNGEVEYGYNVMPYSVIK